jgi:hypothetical protein
MKGSKVYRCNFVHRNSACPRRQNIDITWMIVDEYTGQRDGSPLHIEEDTLITPVFQIWKCEISGPIDTDICSLRSWRASSPTNPNRLKLLGLMTMLTMCDTRHVLDCILCYFRSSFHLTIGFFSFVFYTFFTINGHFYSGSLYKWISKGCQTMCIQAYSNLCPAFLGGECTLH